MPVWIDLTDFSTHKGFSLFVPSIILMEWHERGDDEYIEDPHTSISTARGDVIVAETPEQIKLMILSATRDAMKRCKREYSK